MTRPPLSEQSARPSMARRIAGVLLIVVGALFALLFLLALLTRFVMPPAAGIAPGARAVGEMLGAVIPLLLAAALMWGGIRLQRRRR